MNTQKIQHTRIQKQALHLCAWMCVALCARGLWAVVNHPNPLPVCTQPVYWHTPHKAYAGCINDPAASLCNHVEPLTHVYLNGIECGTKRSPMTPQELWALGHKPSLNDVDVSFLDTLPGIGKSLAHTLVRTREDMGGFKTWEEVDNIPGIGPRTLKNIQARMTLQPPL